MTSEKLIQCGSRKSRSAAFTLIEVLASIAVLSIIVLAMIRVFGDASEATRKGNVTVSRNAAARAALDVITEDLELAVMDRDIAMYQEADMFPLVEPTFDTVYFVTRNTHDPDAGGYLQVRYYVTTNSQSDIDLRGHKTWQLKRGFRTLETARNNGVDMFGAQRNWWGAGNRAGFTDDVLIDNIIRFDVYLMDEDSHLISTIDLPREFGGRAKYDSRIDVSRSAVPSPAPAGDQPANRPPAYVDIYIQVVGDTVMEQAMASLDAGQNSRAYSLMYRESNVLFRRITPRAWGMERAQPLSTFF